MLLIDEEATLGAVPDLLPSDREERKTGFAALCQVLSARGEIAGEAAERLQRIAKLFGVEPGAAVASAYSDPEQSENCKGILVLPASIGEAGVFDDGKIRGCSIRTTAREIRAFDRPRQAGARSHDHRGAPVR